MSPHVNNFVTDLVSMAKAMEELPQVQAALERAHEQNNRAQAAILERDQMLEQSRSYAATLEQKVHDLEVAKDQAETMFLEADERTSRALDFIRSSFANAGALLQALEPVRAAPQADSPVKTETATMEQALTGQGWHEPVAAQLDSHHVSEHSGERESPLLGASAPSQEWSASVSEATAPNSAGQRESDPTVSISTMEAPTQSPNAPSSTAEIVADATGVIGETSMGQRESDPTVSQTQHALSETVGIVEHTDGAKMPSEPRALPYADRRYYDLPNYVSMTAWLAGGGTMEDYEWRPERANRY